MSRKEILLLFAVHLCLLNRISHVAATLTSSPNSTNGTITVCPGDPISITCTHDNDGSITTRWVVTGDSITDCEESVAHGSPMPPDDMCGLFTITMISGEASPTMFTSTAQTNATEALNGAVVECFSSGGSNSMVGNITINVLTIPTPDLSIEQVSQSVVRANLSVTDTQCVASYQVDATPTSGLVSTSSSTDSTFNVTGLNVCENNYTLSGSVFTAGGVQSALSSLFSFTANLSDLNGISVNISVMDPLIKWTQTPNPLYPTCITEYVVTDQENQSLTITVDSTVTSLTTEQLNAAGFPYCISIHPTVTPRTPMRDLTSVMGSSNPYTYLIDPNFPTPMLLTYTFALINQSENETGVVLRVNVQTVSESEVPSRNYRYTDLAGSLSSMVNFTGDMFEIALPGVDGGHVVNVTVMFERGPCSKATIASFTVPERNISNVMQGQPTDTSHTVTITLPLTPYQPEELLIISTVQPSNPIMANFSRPGMQYSVTFDDLMAGTSYTFTVRIVLRANTTVDVVQAAIGSFMSLTTLIPPVMIISSDGQQMSAPVYTVTLSLPEISFPLSKLIIISTLTPADSVPITDDYPLSSQYSVTFNELSAGVEYSYFIRIVLRTNTSVDVSIPVTGSFTLMTSFSTGAAVALTFVLTFLLTLALGVSIGALIVLAVNKWRSEKVTLQTETEMRPPPVIYEEPEAIKPDPLTQGNAAYGEIVY